MKHATEPSRIVFGEGCVVVARSGQSRRIVAEVLGQETDPATGRRTVWLDRMIHRRSESVLIEGAREWLASGAISTVLTEAASS